MTLEWKLSRNVLSELIQRLSRELIKQTDRLIIVKQNLFLTIFKLIDFSVSESW